ncbi:MFS transporter [Ameyamaea chiangmaiensis]|uniref:MFS transporter n=1 Tax=Ameyamaea chiangmaiensis TaxID=442969 RepID=A0A850P5T3_9PROT|nr:MFS transporter [Ameyamaea chiangmaiensis]MBS4076536.1 MFS transporter [Ameyamaea chiangmaiensis]NVN40005.1 MFS transporter [Ameyamaea chiangmaiensis]
MITHSQQITTYGRFPRRFLAPLMLGAILNPINSSIIAVALVPIGAAFGARPAQTAWLVSALYMATAIGQPLVGRFVDVFGPKRLFLLGAFLTMIAGIIGTVAPALWVLVVARVILGLGTCAGYPSAMSLIRKVANHDHLESPASVLTALSVTVQTIAAIGPTLGGLLIALGGWRLTMAINIPLGMAALLLGWMMLPAYGTGTQQDEREALRSFDWAGTALFAVALLGLLLFLMAPGTSTLWSLAMAASAGAAFAFHELRVTAPFIDLRLLWGNLPLLATYARALAASTTSYAFIYGFSQWMEEGRGLSASKTGLLLLPTFGVGILVSTLWGRTPQVRGKLVVGGTLQAVVGSVLLLTSPGSPIWFLATVTALLGIPQGLLSLSNQNALYHQAHPESLGASSGLLRTFQYFGAIIASAATGMAFGHRADTTGMHELAAFIIIVSTLALLVTLLDRSLALAPGAGKSR